MSTVPTYPNVLETSPDLVLASARLAHPKSKEEVTAEILVEQCQRTYDEVLVRAAKTHQDAGRREGFIAGWGHIDPRFETELADADHDLSRAKVRLNNLRLARQAKIRAHVQVEEAKAAIEAQRLYQKQRGIVVPQAEEQRRGVAA